MSNAVQTGKFDPALWCWGTNDDRKRFLHAMVRVTDMDASLRFYTGLLGMKPFGERFDVPSRGSSAIYLGYGGYDVGGGLELTSRLADAGPYAHSVGYSHHVSIGVPWLDELVAQLDAQGVEFVMRPTALLDGGPRNAFIRDPDGYVVELIHTRREDGAGRHDPSLWGWGTHDDRMRFLHAMIRVCDFEASLAFYTKLLGMTPYGERFDVPDRKVTAIFVGYDGYAGGNGMEIVHSWDEPGPFSHGSGYAHHVSIGVPDIDETLVQLEAEGVEAVLQPTVLLEGGPKVAFILDPDGYSIELIQTRRD